MGTAGRPYKKRNQGNIYGGCECSGHLTKKKYTENEVYLSHPFIPLLRPFLRWGHFLFVVLLGRHRGKYCINNRWGGLGCKSKNTMVVFSTLKGDRTKGDRAKGDKGGCAV